MILAIIFAFLGYRRANDAGKNGILWAFIAAGTFIGTQVVISLGIGIFIAVGMELWGWSEELLTKYELLYTVIAIAISFVAGFLVLKLIDRQPAGENLTSSPPPPPKFDGS